MVYFHLTIGKSKIFREGSFYLNYHQKVNEAMKKHICKNLLKMKSNQRQTGLLGSLLDWHS
jgi:hypothetical protein